PVRPSAKTRILISFPPLLLALIFQVFRVFNLYINKVTFVEQAGVYHWQVVMGPFQIINLIYSYAFFFLSLGLIVKYFNVFRKHNRHEQIYLLIASLLLPVLTHVVFRLCAQGTAHDYSPLAMGMSLSLLLYLVRHFSLLRVIPLARTRVIEQMEDALIICDARQRYLDANLAARALFPHIENLQPGDHFFVDKGMRFIEEMQLKVGDSMRTFKVSQTQIRQGKKDSGVCILLHDITQKQEMVEKLFDGATFDSMMNILNRASFFERAEIALTDTGSEFTLMMLDIDHFKRINDLYGHASGDAALQKLARVVQSALRKGDLIGRFGGEEVTILLENVSLSAAMVTASRIRRLVENMTIEHEGNTFHLTVSIGVTHSKRGEPHSLDEMIEQADKALYAVKHSGRNGSLLYESGDEAVSKA
ncbi:MAG: diguanylate cyclase, partial [Clostridiales bacterium]|nr:diguanylate cyclase [Clostridiales bacterium]